MTLSRLTPATVTAGAAAMDATKEVFELDVVLVELEITPMIPDAEAVLMPLYFPVELAKHMGLDYSSHPEIETTKEKDDNDGA